MTNRYPGRCCKCGVNVGAQKGSAAKQGGAWVVYCAGCRTIPDADKPATGPVRIVVTRLDDGEFRVAPSAFLGGDLFGLYRDAVAGMKYVADDKSQRTRDAALLGRALSRLQQASLLLDVAPEVAAAVQAATSQTQALAQAADQRAAAVDAELAKRGLALFPFQRIGVPWLSPLVGAILADDMGLGKTVQAAVAIPSGAATLVVGPAVAKGVWARECRKWRPDLTPIIVSGRGQFRWPKPGELVVINYDVLPPVVETKGKKAADISTPAAWWKVFCRAWLRIGEAASSAHILSTCPPNVVLIADEAHALKAGSRTDRGARFKALAKRVRELGGRSWGLTATPLLNDPAELWQICSVFGCEKEAFGSWKNFLRMAGGYQGRFGIEWEPRNMDKAGMERALQRVMLRRRKVDVLKDLPAKTVSEVVVEIPAKVSKICDAYLELIKACGMTLDQALEVASGTRRDPVTFEAFSRARAALATAKLEAALEMIEAFEDAGEPVVVFSAHRAPIDVLATRPGWAAITGDTSAADRTRIEEDFQAGRLRGVAGTIKAAGVAITLTRATNAIKIDRDPTPALNVQADDRIYRIGTTKPVTITNLVADHALDERISELLAIKEQMIAGSVDAAIRGAEEAPEAEVANLDDAAAALAQAQADLEVELERQRKAAAARKAAQAARDAEEAKERAERDAKEKEGNARKRARKALVRRGHAALLDEVPLEEVRRAPETERERWAATGLVQLAGLDSDHAHWKNDVGFNKADGALGHGLAERVGEGLTDVEWKLSVVMLAKYHGQIGPLPGGPIDLAQQGVPVGGVRDCATEDAASEVQS